MTWITALVTSVGALVTLAVNTVTFDTQYTSSIDSNGMYSAPEISSEIHIDLDEGINDMSDALEPMSDQYEANNRVEEELELQKAAEEAQEKARKDAEEAQAEEEKEALRQQSENEKELAKEEAEDEKALAKEEAENDAELEKASNDMMDEYENDRGYEPQDYEAELNDYSYDSYGYGY